MPYLHTSRDRVTYGLPGSSNIGISIYVSFSTPPSFFVKNNCLLLLKSNSRDELRSHATLVDERASVTLVVPVSFPHACPQIAAAVPKGNNQACGI